MRTPKHYLLFSAFVALCLSSLALHRSAADGKVMPPRNYKGSLEETSQEGIIIFHGSEKAGDAVEDLILKISVQGADTKTFGWVVPFPKEPKVNKEDGALFKELFNYVEARTRRAVSESKSKGEAPAAKAAVPTPVEVLSREIVGSYDVAVVKENEAGALDGWLEKEGFQTLGKDAEDVVGFYRKKGYVFACMKVSDVELKKDVPVDLHPLRFTFKTGGSDGIFFPMKMTGLQKEPFNINLYVFYKAWLNDKLSKYGYVHRGFELRHRDWDSKDCVPNGGKSFSAPDTDVYLKGVAYTIPTVTKLFQKLHPGEKYYLTNVQCHGLKPDDVRAWNDDLWLFPYYTDKTFVPFDAREGGVASAGWK